MVRLVAGRQSGTVCFFYDVLPKGKTPIVYKYSETHGHIFLLKSSPKYCGVYCFTLFKKRTKNVILWLDLRTLMDLH